MAQLALSNASLNKVRTLAQQWEATHGRPATPDVMRGLMEAELSNAAARGQDQQRIDLDREKYDESKRQYEEQQSQAKSAAKVAGIRDTVSTVGTAYQLYEGATAAKAGATVAATGTAASAATAGSGAVSATGAASTAAGTGSASASGAASGAAGSMGSAGVAGLIIAAVLADRKIAGNNTTYNTTGDRVKEAGRGVFAGGLTSGQLASLESKGIKMPGEAVFGSGFKDSNWNPVHVTGDVLGNIYDHVGDLGLGGLADDLGSVICTELVAQDMMGAHLAAAASRHRKEKITEDEYRGYLKWAAPVVRMMRREKRFARVVRVLWTPVCEEMASSVSVHFQSRWWSKIALVMVRKLSLLVYLHSEQKVRRLVNG